MKPRVFISHISDDGPIACRLKDLIETKFLRSVEVFASAHESSLPLGTDWLGAIKSSLRDCQLMVMICSPISVSRPWINFEAGAGWIRDIPVIPLCHSGMEPGQLPIPLKTLQGGLLSLREDIQKLFNLIAAKAEIDSPSLDGCAFFDQVTEFEGDVRKNILFKDSQFVSNLLEQSAWILEHSIYASTCEYNPRGNSISKTLEDHRFTFPDIHRLFAMAPFAFCLNQKVFQVIHATMLQLGETIRFLLSSQHLRLAPDLMEVLREFVCRSSRQYYWLQQLQLVLLPGNGDLRTMATRMIKDSPQPPVRKFSNMINAYIDYYEDLLFCRNWLVEYRKVIGRLIRRSPADGEVPRSP